MIRSTGDPALDAHIARECRYGQTRWAEVWLSVMMVVFGLILLEPTETFDLPSYSIIERFVREDVAGWISLVSGAVRLIALWINGKKGRPTSAVRIVGCFGGFLFNLALGAGFALTYPPLSIGLIFLVWAAAELHSLTRATRDAWGYDLLGHHKRRRARDRYTPA